MARYIIKTLTGINDATVKVYRDTDWDEYQAVIPGEPDATYHTDDKADALRTAATMLSDIEQRFIDAGLEEIEAEQWHSEQRQTLWAERGGYAAGLERPL